MPRYTPKQIEKYRRQKYIALLEKITKNLFRLLRNEATTARAFADKLHALVEQLDALEAPRMDTEYLRLTHAYIVRLHRETQHETFDDARYADMREAEMSNLNRLQKLKNQTEYKKDKHKKRSFVDGWE
jgi:hypothetical protein